MTSDPLTFEGFVGDRLYLDTNVFIYYVEGHRRLAPVLAELFEMIDERAVSVFTSELTLAEVLVKPIADGNMHVAAIYERLLLTSSALKDRKSTRLNSSHSDRSRMPSSA